MVIDRRPVVSILTIGLVVTAALSLVACDSLVRFSYDKYSCTDNALGIETIEIQTRSGLYQAFVTRFGEIDTMDVAVTTEKIILSHQLFSIDFDQRSKQIAALTADTYYALSCQAQERFAM